MEAGYKSGMSKTVLIVDDEKITLSLMKDALDEIGANVFTASTGERALQIAKDTNPDVILLDLVLPGIQGDEVCRRLKEDPLLKNSPVLMVTASQREDHVTRCMAAGCDDYITKPIDPSALLDKISLMLKIAKRTGQRVLIRMEVLGRTDAGFFFGTSTDVSMTGMYIESTTSVDVGSKLTLKFMMPGKSSPIKVDSEVVRVLRKGPESVYGIGIRFKNLNRANMEILKEFITQQAG